MNTSAIDHLLETYNFMEVLVRESVDDVLKKYSCCKCNICRHDIMALALNDLPPKYIVTLKGKVYSEFSALKAQHTADVVVALNKAIDIVSKKPRHAEQDI